MELNSSIKEIKGVGEKSAEAFKKLNIFTVRDLVFNIPRDFTYFEDVVTPIEALGGHVIAVEGYFKSGSFSSVRKNGRTFSHVAFLADDKIIRLTIFNMPYLKNQLDPTKPYVIRGNLEVGSRGMMSMIQPRIYTVENYDSIKGTLQPIYPLVKGLTNNAVSKAVKQVITSVDIPDDGLDEIAQSNISFKDAVKNMHFPSKYDDFIESRKRIVFHEFLSFILQMKTDINKTKNIPFRAGMVETADTVRLIEKLPYRLTNAQLKTWEEIKSDMTSNICMNRLIQGDVGSGKTIIAFLSLIMNAKNNHQGALMAPTEVLAKQHFDKLVDMIETYNLEINVVLLVGSMSIKSKNAVYEDIKNHRADIVIGTHALFQQKVLYDDLTLVITDEQHRFGVNQRQSLVDKGQFVHLLVMSATPIPRTLAMILYGDISISTIDELPGNRIPIKNCVVGREYRKKSYEFIEKEVNAGHQAYVICPQIEEGVDDSQENVIDYSKKLSIILPSKVSIAYLHGKMSAEQKEKIMLDFKCKNIDVLVSTTVIEVGVDVPNATVMLIENSERFGLAQLHQLRGRVGRGKYQSYCIFISSKNDKDTMKRLSILNESNDGFKIADEDMKMRGPGDLFGIRQSGDFGFYIGDIYNDSQILKEASKCADILVSNNNEDYVDDIMDKLKDTMINTVDFRSI